MEQAFPVQFLPAELEETRKIEEMGDAVSDVISVREVQAGHEEDECGFKNEGLSDSGLRTGTQWDAAFPGGVPEFVRRRYSR